MPIAAPRIDVSAPKLPLVRPKEIKSLQAARGIAAFLVVTCHSAAFLGEEPGLWQRTPIYLWFRGTVLGVQMFFVISGVVIFRAHREDFDQPQKAGAFYWKRFRRIYPLYWICLLPTLWKHRAVTDLHASYQHLPSVIVSSYLLIHLFSYQTIMVQAWTLFDEIQFYLVFSLCILLLYPTPLTRYYVMAAFSVILLHLIVVIHASPDRTESIRNLLLSPVYLFERVKMFKSVVRASSKGAAWVRTTRDASVDVSAHDILAPKTANSSQESS